MAIKREDYTPSAYLVSHFDMTFRLDIGVSDGGKRECEIETVMSMRLNPQASPSAGANPSLVLNAEALNIIEVSIDGAAVAAGSGYIYDADAEILTIEGSRLGDKFSLKTKVLSLPEDNLQLQGLFCSSGMFCTQMEAEGFRRMVPCLDRTDVLSTYRVRIEGSKELSPQLLGNGNRVEAGDVPGSEGARHFAVFEDPHPKPTYLFAVVAGKLWSLKDTFTFASGREVAIEVFVDGGPERVASLGHAMESVKVGPPPLPQARATRGVRSVRSALERRALPQASRPPTL